MALQMTDGVKLPTRTRDRIAEQGEINRVAKPHDIRGSIPLVDYTNPAKFPSYVFREYPKMPLLDGNKPIVVDEVGTVLVFFDAEDETEFMDMNPEIAEEIERNSPAKLASNKLAQAADEIEELRRKLMAAGIDPDAGKRRTSVPTTKVSGLARGEFKPPVEEPEEGGLREQIAEAKAAESEASAIKSGGNPLRKKKQ